MLEKYRTRVMYNFIIPNLVCCGHSIDYNYNVVVQNSIIVGHWPLCCANCI